MDCIRQLRKMPPHVSHEIIVIDNNSTDDTAAAIVKEFSDVQVLCGIRRMWDFSKACNKGAKMAKDAFSVFSIAIP